MMATANVTEQKVIRHDVRGHLMASWDLMQLVPAWIGDILHSTQPLRHMQELVNRDVEAVGAIRASFSQKQKTGTKGSDRSSKSSGP